MSLKRSFDATTDRFENDKMASSQLDIELNRLEPARCNVILEQPKLMDRFFSDSEMNHLLMLVRFFKFLLQSTENCRTNAAKLVVRLPGSDLLKFAYEHLKSSSMAHETEITLLQEFVPVLSQVLQFLLALHPSCFEQLDQLGIFDRLELYGRKASIEDKLCVTKLISQVEKLRHEHEQKTKKFKSKVEIQVDRDDPPPDDFHDLSIYPTLDDIFESQMSYLRKNIITGQYKDGTHYLDIHFRLLREDFLWPLRESICQYMNDGNQNANVRLYKNSILTGSIWSQAGILFSISIDMKTLPKSISWIHSRRLIYGNLLAATFDDFATSCFLLTVEDRSNIDKNGTISVRCQKELCDLKFMRIPSGTSFTLLETTSYFEAYRPILQALQNIKDDRIPLEKYLLHCETNVAFPNYFELQSEIDFRPMLAKSAGEYREFDGRLSNVKDRTTWPNAEQLGLDKSQYEALQLALTKSVALIQGPPGCGKTFLGVRLAELFYHNRERIDGCKRPILMICYTNHALDQFLSSIIKKLSLRPGQIVRVGGRSTHSEIEPFLIQNLRHQRRDIPSKNEGLATKHESLKNIKKQMDDFQQQCYKYSQQILDITQLLRVMNKTQFLSFIKPILSNLDIYRTHWNSSKGGIYCCRSTRSNEPNGYNSGLDDCVIGAIEEPLSPYEKYERLKNRINCQRLSNLSHNDQREINQLFIQWLDAKPSDIFAYRNKEQDKEDNENEFKEQRRKNKTKASLILEELYSERILPSTSNNQINLEDDEEETRRLNNVDSLNIPFTFSTPNREKQINTEQFEYMQQLLNNRTSSLSETEMENVKDLWSKEIDKNQRQAFYRYWLRKYVHLFGDDWYRLNERYDEIHRSVQELWLANDRLYMEKAFIIAMTTHCASRYQKVLKQIAPRICIVEEAAEVFESHIVTAIGEHIEHLILIGDHVQLRPSPNVYTLAKHFNLDVSLFERLIKNQMPSVQLCVQHRSIPIISSLTHHFYDIPILNHLSVLNRRSITGISHPLYFIDHQNVEENVADGTSKRNSYESDYLIQLASYLIHQGYEKSEITILTTYMGQRQQIQRTMKQFEHLKGIHVTVVDNFQGEENRIILLSLVRSNADQRLGYIGVDNRICVALSRAQDGFYVIGNFHLLAEESKTWKIIVNKIKQLKLIGQGLPINCANHLDNQLICIHPNDFLKRPLGGCGLACEARLFCGHQCPLRCHSTSHNRLICQKLCLKQYDDCKHRCQRRCHSATECLPCNTSIPLKMSDCKHTSNIPCSMRKFNQLECDVLVPYTCPIGHQVQVRCCDLKNKQLRDQLCTQPCDSILECGHSCAGTCSGCLQKRFHCPCNQEELVVYICGHSRKQRCHEVGPRCKEPCIKICDHKDEPEISALSNQCVIYQCTRFCLNRCRHTRCGLRCNVECDRSPCYQKCTRRFECEHFCNGMCGEPCIDCLSCRKNELPNEIREAIAGSKVRDATFVQLECGHLFKTDLLDRHVENFKKKNFLSNGYMYIDYPRCPLCQWSLVRCQRYSDLIKKIQHRIENVFSQSETLSTSSRSAPLFLNIFMSRVSGLPEHIIKMIERESVNDRQYKLTKQFLHVVRLFHALSNRMDIERDRLLNALYKHVQKHDSIFLTRQQWSDLEKEYNRLKRIDRWRASEEMLDGDFNKSEREPLDDGPFGPNRFIPFKCEFDKALLTSTTNDTNEWNSILIDQMTWKDFEKDQLLCDGKWIVCPKATGGHLMWIGTMTEQSTCSECQTSGNQQTGLTVRHGNNYQIRNFDRPPFHGGYGRRAKRRRLW